jgi:F-box/WD-40 domain protein 7
VWDADTHKHLATLEEHTDDVKCLTLYGNKLFSSGSADSTIRVWDADTHEHLATLAGHTGAVRCLTLYGNKLFSGSFDKTIRVWNVKEEDS